MPKVLFIALHRPNRSPSQRFRYEQYIPFLKERGWQVEVSFLIKEKWDQKFYSSGHYFFKLKVLLSSIFHRMRDVKRARDFDIVFIQREALMIGSSYFEKQLAKTGAKLIYDFDDAIWLPNVSDGNQRLGWLKYPEKIREIIRVADLVIAGNKYLAQFALQYNSKVVVFPTTIDTDRHIPNERGEKGKVCIGWTGSKTTIPHFKTAIPVLMELKKRYGDILKFKVIGDETYVNEDLGIKGVAWNLENEIEELSELDIGIMPLPDDEWSKGKCALKSLQYMALEIPCVISPVGMNTELINQEENGYLAYNDEDWMKYLSELIENKEQRQKTGQLARKTVLEKFSVESKKDEFFEYFDSLIQDR